MSAIDFAHSSLLHFYFIIIGKWSWYPGFKSDFFYQNIFCSIYSIRRRLFKEKQSVLCKKMWNLLARDIVDILHERILTGINILPFWKPLMLFVWKIATYIGYRTSLALLCPSNLFLQKHILPPNVGLVPSRGNPGSATVFSILNVIEPMIKNRIK